MSSLFTGLEGGFRHSYHMIIDPTKLMVGVIMMSGVQQSQIMEALHAHVLLCVFYSSFYREEDTKALESYGEGVY